MAGYFEQDKERPQQSDIRSNRSESRFNSGYGGPSRGGFDSPSEVPPNISLPEVLHPNGLVEVKLDKLKWFDVLKSVNADPLKYRTEPKEIKVQTPISPTSRFITEVNPMGANIDSDGSVNKWAFHTDLKLSDEEGSEDTFSPKTVEAANRRAVLLHLVNILGEGLGWRKISEDYKFKTAPRKIFETPSGNSVKLEHFTGIYTRIQFGSIAQANLENSIEEMRRAIEVAADYISQMLQPHNSNRTIIDLPHPILSERWDKNKNHGRTENRSGQQGSERGLISGFDIEEHKVEVTGFSLEDLGGNPEVKAEIEGLVELFSNPDHFRRYGAAARPPRGVLLEGPPGTGKTLTAKIVASSLGIPFYELSSAELKNVWAGESPKIVKSIFETCETPCVLFFDEFDAIGRSREELSSMERDIMQGLLTGMQGLSEREGIVVIAATNNAELLDPALKRSGRFDRKIHVGLPDKPGRTDIFKIQYKKSLSGVEPGLKIFSGEINDTTFSQLSELTEGFSGADIAEVYRRAVFEVARKALKNPDATISHNDLPPIIESIKKEKLERQKRTELGFRTQTQNLNLNR